MKSIFNSDFAQSTNLYVVEAADYQVAAADYEIVLSDPMVLDSRGACPMFAATGLHAARSATETLNFPFGYYASQLHGSLVAYTPLPGIDLRSAYAGFTPYDFQINRYVGLPQPDFYAGAAFYADAALPSMVGACEVSGAYLKSTIVELKSLQNTQRALDTKIESIQRRWASFCKELDASVTLLQAVIFEKLHTQLVKRWTRTKARIVALSRRVKAIKRAMRQRQRALFLGLTKAKWDWYLLHGAHPPEAQSFHTELSIGGVRS